jgi:hypothetical protein
LHHQRLTAARWTRIHGPLLKANRNSGLEWRVMWCELSDRRMPLYNVNYVATWQLLSSHSKLKVTWIQLIVAFYIWIQIVNTSNSKMYRIPSICKAQQVQEFINHWTDTWGSRDQSTEVNCRICIVWP